MNQCMMRISASGLLGEWQSRLPARFPGNQMDGVNVLYPMLPTDADIIDVEPLSEEDMLTVDVIDVSEFISVHQRVMAVSQTLLRPDNGFVIIAKQEQWSAMYNTPYWRLWCAPYIYESDSDEQYQSDLAEVGLASTTTRTEAREAIKTMVSS